jgi:hypothetical protein
MSDVDFPVQARSASSGMTVPSSTKNCLAADRFATRHQRNKSLFASFSSEKEDSLLKQRNA